MYFLIDIHTYIKVCVCIYVYTLYSMHTVIHIYMYFLSQPLFFLSLKIFVGQSLWIKKAVK